MARKQKTKDNGGGLVILLIAFLIAILATLVKLFVMLYLVVLPVAYLYYSRASKAHPLASSDKLFIATREEARQIAAYEKDSADAGRHVASLNDSGQSLAVRQDGKFNERSALGKRLNAALATGTAEVAELESNLFALRSFASARLAKWVHTRSAASAWKAAGLVLVASLCVLPVVEPMWVADLSQSLGGRGWPGDFSGMPLAWGVLTASAGLSCGLMLIATFYMRGKLRRQLEDGPRPERIQAVLFTERYAAWSNIGQIDPADLIQKQDALAQHGAPIGATTVLTPSPPAVVESVGVMTSQPVKTRPIWKRLLTAVLLGSIGFVVGLLSFGLSGQASLGVVLVLVLPLIGLVWGYQFRKFPRPRVAKQS